MKVIAELFSISINKIAKGLPLKMLGCNQTAPSRRRLIGRVPFAYSSVYLVKAIHYRTKPRMRSIDVLNIFLEYVQER